MPAGLLVTVPLPRPVLSTRSVAVPTFVNLAVQVVFCVTVTVPSAQSAGPLHPSNLEPRFGVAVSLTTVPAVYDCEQSLPQVMSPGLLVTVPPPVPCLVTVSVALVVVNVAVQVVTWVTVTVPSGQSAGPLHPSNRDPVAGAAVSLTVAPATYDCEQSLPQLMPAGLLVTVPAPVPCLVTVSMKLGGTTTVIVRVGGLGSLTPRLSATVSEAT
jgi:hypothetical protein